MYSHQDLLDFFDDVVGVTRLELATTRPPDAYANQLRHTPNLEGGIAHQKHLLPNCECKGSAEIAILQAKPQKPIAFLTENSNFAISFCYLHHNMTQNILPRRCCNDLAPLPEAAETAKQAASMEGDRGTGHCPGWFKIVFEIFEMIFLPIPVSRWS